VTSRDGYNFSFVSLLALVAQKAKKINWQKNAFAKELYLTLAIEFIRTYYLLDLKNLFFVVIVILVAQAKKSNQ
jgi:hypothetical protein